MFNACKRLKCFGHYNEFNNFCLGCEVAVECYNKTKGIKINRGIIK